MSEYYKSPELKQPSWEELLVGVIVRKVMPEDDPNRPADLAQVTSCHRYFRTADGEALTITGFISLPTGGPFVWSAAFQKPGTPENSGYSFQVLDNLGDGQLHLVPDGSELPLPSSAAEHLLGRIAGSTPLGDTDYWLRSDA